MTTVLVTGATGFIGRHTIEHLLAEDTEIVALGRRPLEDGRFRSIQCDVTVAESVSEAVRTARPDSIIHLAGLANGHDDPDLILPTFTANLTSTVHVLDAALTHGVPRIVLSGSLDEVAPDDDPCPTSPYAASKTGATMYARLAARHGLDVVNARVFMGFGPHQPSHKLIPSVAASFLRGEVPVIHAPDREYDWIYVGDIASALTHLALKQPSTPPEYRQLDVGTGVLTSIRSVVHLLAEICGRPAELDPAADTGGERVIRRADTAPMRSIGWASQIPLRTGLERVIEHLGGQQASEADDRG